jgi:hypothetical protein
VKYLSETHQLFGVANALFGVAVQRYEEGRVQVVCARTVTAEDSNMMLFMSLIVSLFSSLEIRGRVVEDVTLSGRPPGLYIMLHGFSYG